MSKVNMDTKTEGLYTSEALDYSFDLSSIPEKFRAPLAKALALLPHHVIDFLLKNTVFITPDISEKGSYWHLADGLFKKRLGIVILNPPLWENSSMQIAFTIAHESAHAYKRHSQKLDFKDQLAQEDEADKLAIKWLSKVYKKKDIQKMLSTYRKDGR